MALTLTHQFHLASGDACVYVGDFLSHRFTASVSSQVSLFAPYAARVVAPRKGIQCSLGLDSTPWIPDSRYWISVFTSGTRILDSLSCILDCKTQNAHSISKIFFRFRIPQAKFCRFRNPDSLTRGSVVSREAVLSIIRIKVAPGI